MGVIEDRVRGDINAKFGNISKMATETGIPATTIYHALERGLENATSKTRDNIYSELYERDPRPGHTVSYLTEDEAEVAALYRSLSGEGRSFTLTALRAWVEAAGSAE